MLIVNIGRMDDQMLRRFSFFRLVFFIKEVCMQLRFLILNVRIWLLITAVPTNIINSLLMKLREQEIFYQDSE